MTQGTEGAQERDDRRSSGAERIGLNSKIAFFQSLAFRDYLQSHPDTAQEYSDLKRRLVQTCDGDIDAYLNGKDAFVKEIERKALEWANTSYCRL